MSGVEQDWRKVYGHLFDEGEEDGLPVPGQVIKYFRELKIKPDGSHWTTQDLAEVLGLESKRTIEHMENENAFLDSISRRRALVVALGIPPFLLGLTPFKGVSLQMEEAIAALRADTSVTESSFEVLHTALLEYWGQLSVDTAQDKLTEVEQIIRELQKQAKASNNRQYLYMLCGYRQLAVNIAREVQDYPRVFRHVNKAIEIARSLQDKELLATTLQERATALYEQGNVIASVESFEEAIKYSEHIYPALRGYIFVNASVSLAHVAQTTQEKSRIKHLLSHAESSRGSSNSEYIENGIAKPQYFDPDMLSEWAYHNTKAHALLELTDADAALRELELARQATPLDAVASFAYNNVYQAKAYAAQGHIPMAATLASEALEIFLLSRSKLGKLRVSQIADDLGKSKYSSSIEIAQLRVKLIKPFKR